MKANRAYKRNEPHRDARLFVIVCEGEKREREYFEHIRTLAPTRIRLKVVDAPAGAPNHSAPKWLLDRAAAYTEADPLTDDDQLWFVMDTDRWPQAALRQIAQACAADARWNMAVSNPCFEVWLYLHLDDIAKSSAQSCKQMKTALVGLMKGGYSPKTFVPFLKDANRRAEDLDNNSEHDLPGRMQTKMWRLGKELVKFLPKR